MLKSRFLSDAMRQIIVLNSVIFLKKALGGRFVHLDIQRFSRSICFALTLKPVCSIIADMKRYIVIIALLIGAISGSGCEELKVVSASQRVPRRGCKHCDEKRQRKKQTSTASEQPANETEKTVLTAIAATEKLSKDEQLELIALVFDELDTETDKQEVLLELIDNDDFNCDAKMAILERLKDIRDIEIRRDILQAFHRRGDCMMSN